MTKLLLEHDASLPPLQYTCFMFQLLMLALMRRKLLLYYQKPLFGYLSGSGAAEFSNLSQNTVHISIS